MADLIARLNLNDTAYYDATDTFHAEANALGDEELLTADSFSLFDAIAAIELMDPKMDSGMMPENPPSKTLSDDDLSRSIIPISELFYVLEKIIHCQMTWCSGYQLSQTLMTCQYLFQVDKVQDPLLKPFLMATLKIIRLVDQLFQDTMIYFEEDYIPDTHHFYLASDVDVNHKQIFDKVLPEASKRGLDDEQLFQLKFYIQYYNLMISILDKTQPVNIDDLQEMIYSIDEHIKRGFSEDEKFVGSFNPHLHRRLFSGIPPRVATIFDFTKAWNFLSRILKDVLYVEKLSRLNFLSLVNTLYDFSLRNETVPHITRCLLLAYVWREYYSDPRSYILQSLQEFAPSPYVSSNNPKVKAMLMDFVDATIPNMNDLFKVLCLNRGRMHRQLIKLIGRLDTLQIDAHIALYSTISKKSSNSTAHHFHAYFIYLLKLKLIEFYLLLGFDLDLYIAEDYIPMFWYLDYIYTTMRQCLQKTQELTESASKFIDTNRWQSRLGTSGMDVTVKQDICRGLFRILCGLKMDGIFLVRSFPLSSPDVRFMRRFGGLSTLSSPYGLSYDDFMKNSTPTSRNVTPVQLYEGGIAVFESAKARLDAVKDHTILDESYDVTLWKKLCIANIVAMKMFMARKDTAKTVSFEWSSHRHFPILKFQ